MKATPSSATNASENMQTVFVMLGAPGAGKGTQAIRLSDRFGIPQISTGDLFRDNIRRNTAIGQEAKSYMEKGQLAPDELVLKMLFERLSQPDCARGYILDGFPRTLAQAEALTAWIAKQKAYIIALNLEVPDQVIVERLSGRLVCEQCGAPYHKTATPPQQEGICDRDGARLVQRKDDTAVVIMERLKIFHEQTEPLKDFFKNLGSLESIDGNLSKEATNAQVDAAVGRHL